MTVGNKVVGIVQARMGSTRLPGKVMADLGGRPLVAWALGRLARAHQVDEVWLATSEHPENDPLAEFATKSGYQVVRGSETDVLSRFAESARRSKADVIVRVTADCPFIDPTIVDDVLHLRAQQNVDYATNTIERRHPDGLDVEVFTRAALDRADKEATDPILREHVTHYISGKRRNVLPWGGFSSASLSGHSDFSHLRWTVDEADDLAFVRAVVAALSRDDFSWLDVIALITQRPELLQINAGHVTNQGFLDQLAARNRRFDRSNQLFSRALEVVPLASQTFSKSHQQWVKGASPLFIERGRGCHVWDVDGNSYIDYVLGLMPIVLGYLDPDVDNAIREQLEKGIVFSLASPLEMEVAERLKSHIPCAEMARFGKNGSDATTAAIRIARAHTGRDKVLLCGYHGWHDWSIGTTTRDLGVPAAVKALSSTIAFNDADTLEAALQADPDGIAAVILEPAGAAAPAPGFLQRVRELTESFGVVLVFDEIVTGFRMSLGGAQAYYGVTPDLACFGKAMANGMPLAAIVGRAHLMRLMEEVFISTTFGGEALSLAAAGVTIDKIVRENVPARLWARGERLRDGFNLLAGKAGLGGVMAFGGDGWWPRVQWKSQPVPGPLLVSLARQEFVANGLLLGGSFNLCLAHDEDRVEQETMKAIATALASLRDHLDAPDPRKRLRGDPVQPTFSVR